jgi:hypothetical protein
MARRQVNDGAMPSNILVECNNSIDNDVAICGWRDQLSRMAAGTCSCERRACKPPTYTIVCSTLKSNKPV